MEVNQRVILLPTLARGRVRHIVWPPGCTFPVVSGDVQAWAGGGTCAGYDAAEFWRALVVTGRLMPPDSYTAVLVLRRKVETEFYALPVTAPDARGCAGAEVDL